MQHFLNLQFTIKFNKLTYKRPSHFYHYPKNYILSLQNNPEPHDTRPLRGYELYRRADVGEYRIIYRYDQGKALITVVIVGKRNDDAVYRIAKRIL